MKKTFTAQLLNAPLAKHLRQILTYIRRYRAIIKARQQAKTTGFTQYVFPIHAGKRFVVLDTRQEALLRKKSKTKRWSFKKLNQGAIYTARP